MPVFVKEWKINVRKNVFIMAVASDNLKSEFLTFSPNHHNFDF